MDLRSSWAICLTVLLSSAGSGAGQYDPNWDSLDTRPLPAWYDEAKIGIFIHWGVFSVPSFGSEWFWEFWKGDHKPEYIEFMRKNYRPGFTYQDFASMFTAEFYNATEWAEIFSAAGANYVVLTSKHHEGFTNWPSKVSWGWNSMDVGPQRDLVGELASAVKSSQHLHFGLYHSLFEWFNPIYLQDKSNSFDTNNFVVDKTMPELMELVESYEPEVIWSDGDAGPDWYWNSTVFLAWLFNESPVKETVVVNDRWGDGVACQHGSFYTCQDRYNPGKVQNHKWENCMTLDKHSWGYRRNAPVTDYLTIEELLTTMAETISCGGNLLVNVGPTHDGMIPAIMEQRLRQMGEWLGINGEAIYASEPWAVQNDTLTPGVWYTSNGDKVYAILTYCPDAEEILLGSVVASDSSTITMLGDSDNEHLKFSMEQDALHVQLPPLPRISSKWMFVLAMEQVQPVPEESNSIWHLP